MQCSGYQWSSDIVVMNLTVPSQAVNMTDYCHYILQRDLLDLFEKQSVEQIVIMNNNVTNRR